jgi:P-type conjugative transfer protein TrbJ
MQALQVGNQVAVEQVAQMQKLKQLVMSQTQAQSNYFAARQSGKDAKEAEMKDLL